MITYMTMGMHAQTKALVHHEGYKKAEETKNPDVRFLQRRPDAVNSIKVFSSIGWRRGGGIF